jgi:hypothetical protein
MKVKFDITPQSQAEFRKTLRKISDEYQRPIGQLLKRTAVYYAQSARKVTPISKKKREFEEAENFAQRQAWGAKFRVGIWRRGSFAWKPTKTRRAVNDLLPIKYRGAAKGSWTGMIKKLGGSAIAVTGVLKRVFSDGSRVVVGSKSATNRYIDTENMLGYIRKLRPGIVGESIAKAENRIVNAELRRIERAMERAAR